MDERLEQLRTWLRAELGFKAFTLAPASSDASFRRYFRIGFDGETVIAMDAPPTHEDCRPFVAIARAFLALGVNVPRILEQDLQQGFLLLSDLGHRQYLDELNVASVDRLYEDALRTLVQIQRGRETEGFSLPPYDESLLQREMSLFEEWFIGGLLRHELDDSARGRLHDTFDFLAASALEQPTVWVHRDYHSRNLMFTERDNPGVLDFQDAVRGPVTYDLVSLLRDCYIAWPRERVEAWVAQFYQHISAEKDLGGATPAQFVRWFDLMGIQRHLKAIGIFARLNLRDAKPGYLKDIPRTMAYVVSVASRYDELAKFAAWLEASVIPAMNAYFTRPR